MGGAHQLQGHVRVVWPDRAALVGEHGVLGRDVPIARRVHQQHLERVVLLQRPEDLVAFELDTHLVAAGGGRLLDDRGGEGLVAELCLD